MKLKHVGIVQSGPYSGQKYVVSTSGCSLPRWIRVYLFDKCGNAERDVRVEQLEAE